ncbi:hypothetical protein BLNAU_14601 [Blattamonas nauphoetae]|uniref:RBPJ-interacting and tubulin-associated protein 1 n=1 Tax=Blattamonas nauphoetae TaxID=2049346 RepID=A0ABQ9XDC6_9EUKA|nr:hypothetical protein BLNAU_14601 [Blattamonas nauphoetae]
MEPQSGQSTSREPTSQSSSGMQTERRRGQKQGLSKTMPASSRRGRNSNLGSTKHSIEDEEKHLTTLVSSRSRSPGPIYHVSESAISVMPRTRSSSFSTEDRLKLMTTTRSHSPGYVYKPQVDFCSTRPRSPGARWSKKERNCVLIGQLQSDVFYSLPKPDVVSNKPKSPSRSFGTDERTKYFVRTTANPGPGSYNPASTVSVKKDGSVKGPWSRASRGTTDWCF